MVGGDKEEGGPVRTQIAARCCDGRRVSRRERSVVACRREDGDVASGYTSQSRGSSPRRGRRTSE
jgi:hypothetical protein